MGNLRDSGPSTSAAAITKSDTVNLAQVTRGIYVGDTDPCNIVAIINGSAIPFIGLRSGTILPVAATRVNSTSTTATNMVALF